MKTTIKILHITAFMLFSGNLAFGSVLNCQTSVAAGEGEKILDDETQPITVTPMEMADISLKPMYGYKLSGSVRADRVTIYASGNGILLTTTGQNLAELNIGKSNNTESFVVNCAIK